MMLFTLYKSNIQKNIGFLRFNLMKNSKSTGVKFLDRYISKKKLGKGAFGDVYLVEDSKGGGELMALKMINK